MKKYTPEQIVSKLRQADRELGKGQTVKEVCRTIETSEQTYKSCEAPARRPE
ncbi:MAG: hypothetical protein QGG53_20845 [Planctomycetota bacterium]|jgi:hypothetical protein|nr:hypothetical protein [Planctomycetota bacterium]